MTKNLLQMIQRVVELGVTVSDAWTLRRCSMTLHRWHELECGDGNDYASWCITRGRKVNGSFEHDDDDGKPFEERHVHSENKARYTAIPDRESGAKKRIHGIMAKHPDLMAYVQTDPRGCALYVVRKSDVPEGTDVDQVYNSRGIAIHK